MKTKLTIIGAAMIAASLYGAPMAWGKSSPAGETAAKAVCAHCHDTSGSPPSTRQGREGAPPAFVAIAQNPKITSDALRKFLRLPHGDMNNVILTEREIDALIDYIQGLSPAAKSKN